MPEEKPPPEQIPWAERTKVTWLSDTSASFHKTQTQDKTTAEVWARNFEWSILLDTENDIKTHMKLDKRLTKEIQEFWEEDEEKYPGNSYKERILRWLKTGAMNLPPEGPKEWRPRTKRGGRVGNLAEGYRYGNTYNEDNAYWWADVIFEFAHFFTMDGDEAAVIMWNRTGNPMAAYTSPEVWLGDFEAFMDSQYEHDPWDHWIFHGWNQTFENGFMWAWHRMGVFRDWDEHIDDLRDRHVRQVLEAIEKDPSILLPESVQQIIENDPETYPKEIQKAVTWLMTNKRWELERALGQKLIWGDLYAD